MMQALDKFIQDGLTRKLYTIPYIDFNLYFLICRYSIAFESSFDFNCHKNQKSACRSKSWLFSVCEGRLHLLHSLQLGASLIGLRWLITCNMNHIAVLQVYVMLGSSAGQANTKNSTSFSVGSSAGWANTKYSTSFSVGSSAGPPNVPQGFHYFLNRFLNVLLTDKQCYINYFYTYQKKWCSACQY